ncbi:hypothetical protein BaRGS_00033053 [Batillaria attramentaria]|uniref:Uncharacterized protein n=1 Tax=Batillaria attramentaria TaxID=370345 RepID=A0ABD0JMG6_9CAEN
MMTAACASPPALPKLQIASESLSSHAYSPGDNVTYTCDDGLYAVEGSGRSACTNFSWSEPTLVCKEDPKLTKEGIFFHSNDGKWERSGNLNPVADDMDKTCTEGPFTGIRVELEQDVDVSHITVKFEVCPSGFQHVYGDSCYHTSDSQIIFAEAKAECEGMGAKLAEVETQGESEFLKQTAQSVVNATIETRANRTKPCSTEMPKIMDQNYTAMTCPQMPAGKAVNIHFDAVVVRVCEIRIFGRWFDGGELRLIRRQMAFWEAEQTCAKEGGHLVSIHDVTTEDTVAQLCRRDEPELPGTDTCVSVGTEFRWKWNSTHCQAEFYSICRISPSNSTVAIRPEDTGLHSIQNATTFEAAEVECRKRGGHLVSIHDQDTRNRTVEVCRQAVSSGVCGCWIGFNVYQDIPPTWTDDSPVGEYRDCVDTSSYSGVLECLQTEDGRDYKGDVSFTRTGRTCLPWNEFPLFTSHDPFVTASLADAGSKCRNPFGFDRTAPWCYVSKQPEDWDYCTIPPCSPMCEMPNALFEYDGEKNTTSDGTPCVHWQDPDTNHTVASYRKEDFPGGDMRHNYCRNPGRSQSSLWCYTNKSGSSYGHCSVPQCPTALLHFHESDEAIPNLEYCFNPVTQASSTFHNIREALQKFCNDTVQALCYTGSYMVAISISCDVCGPPPKVARMKSPDGVYRANDSATYTCDDDFYPISDGPTTITCQWTNYASQGGARAEDASLSTLSELTDDDVTSCVSLDSRTYTLHLVSEVEVGVVTFHFGE